MTILTKGKKASRDLSKMLLILLGLLIASKTPSTPLDPAAQSIISWPQISLTRIVSGLSQPTFITHAGDESGRLFAVKQVGEFRIIKNGVLQHARILRRRNSELN